MEMMKGKHRVLSIALAAALVLTAAFALPFAGVDGGAPGSAIAYAADPMPQAGDIVYFGSYPQDLSVTQSAGEGRTSSGGLWYDVGPVAWKVLTNANGRMSLLSEKNLDSKPYHTTNEAITWEKSSLRSWLNGYAGSEAGESMANPYPDSFIGKAFTAAEKNAIATTPIINEDNPDHSTDGGSNTLDRIFLLSLTDATNKAYGFNEIADTEDTARIAVNTAYVASLSGMNPENSADLWWLRSPGSGNNSALLVFDDGDFAIAAVSDSDVAVRPAITLDLGYVAFLAESGNQFSAVLKSSVIKPAITTGALPDGSVGTAYSQSLAATADNRFDVTWSVGSGSLPAGLNLTPDGTISGTPAAAGTFTFGVSATNAGGSDTKEFAVTILGQTGAPPVAAGDILGVRAPVAPGSGTALPKSVTFPDGTSAEVTWTSGNTSVARIDADGNLVAVGEGEATLTARTADGKTQTIKVTIAKPVTSVRTPLTKIYLVRGKPLTPPVCAYSVNPATKKTETAAKLTWESSKPNIATVNSATGKITPKKTGRTVITATSLNGKAKLKITVFVVKKPKPLKNIALTKPPKSLKQGKTATLKIKASPANATNLKVTFASSKPKIISIDKAGKLTALKKGKSKITIKIGTRKYTKEITVK
jgi:uncharacterized protein YjdB